MKQVQVAVVGASGYTGQELLRILLNHRGVKLVPDSRCGRCFPVSGRFRVPT